MQIKEIHLRVKNNLNLVFSLIRMNASVGSDSNSADQLVSQINAIGFVHINLYCSEQLKEVNLREYVYDLLHSHRSYSDINDLI